MNQFFEENEFLFSVVSTVLIQCVNTVVCFFSLFLVIDPDALFCVIVDFIFAYNDSINQTCTYMQSLEANRVSCGKVCSVFSAHLPALAPLLSSLPVTKKQWLN